MGVVGGDAVCAVALPAKYVFRPAASVLLAAGMCWNVQLCQVWALSSCLCGWLVDCARVVVWWSRLVTSVLRPSSSVRISHARHCLMRCCKVVFAPSYRVCVSPCLKYVASTFQVDWPVLKPTTGIHTGQHTCVQVARVSGSGFCRLVGWSVVKNCLCVCGPLGLQL